MILNGVPRKSFNCKRGVRQGDPLSPLLFVLATDLLQSVINKAWQNGVLKYPLCDDFGGNFPILQYADDTFLILSSDARTLFNSKCLLRPFSDSTGLHVNFEKSFLVPINISEERTTHLARTFGCKVGSMSFTDLGLPLGTTKPTLYKFSPLLNKIERRLTSVSKCLSYNGRLILVNSVFLPYLLSICAVLEFPLKSSSKLMFTENIAYWARGH